MRKFSIIGLCVCCIGIQASASVVYEGFEYGFTVPIVGQGTDTNGWDGAWAGTDNDGRGTPEVGTGLAFDGVVGADGSYSRPGRYGVAQSSRVMSASSLTALTGDNSTIYFSVLMNANPTEGGADGGGYTSNSNGALIFGDTAYGLANPATAPMANTGNGLGVSFDGDASIANISIRGVSYLDGIQTWNTNALTIGESTVMIVGKIEWNEDGTDDVMSLYNITDTEAALPTAFATVSNNWNQASFTMVAIGQGQTEVFDEIRFDPTLAGVGVGDVIPTDPIEIGDISYQIIGDDIVLSWYGEPGQLYELGIKDDLTAVTWDTVTNVVGADATITVADEMDQTNAFYQVSSPE